MSKSRLLAAAAALAVLGGCVGTTYEPAYQPTYQPMTRGDNPNLPSPVTPSGANESAPQPQRDPTNTTGMGR
jgi:hypothetical protein